MWVGGRCGAGSSPLARGLRRLGQRAAAVAGIIPARAGFTCDVKRMDGDARDHPRSRGVYPAQTATRLAPLGSSPLARGLQHVGVGPQHDPGIIPARAGFTRTGRPATARRWDHPRSRGVYVDDGGHLPVHPGIIPARAGFTERTTRTERGGGDHPRSRGVYMAATRALGAPAGSSPLARGLPPLARALGGAHGIIPARAGFTPTHTRMPRRRPDHPRSRGVYSRGCSWCASSAGSSPLARGLLSAAVMVVISWGIIPARAGFTVALIDADAAYPDHPRSRGVYGSQRPPAVAAAGSSPLARGLRGVAADALLPGGDHPRSRGVYRAPLMCRGSVCGSSPLARGLPARADPGEDHHRIIPARAGFTGVAADALLPGGDHPRSRGVYTVGWTSSGAPGGSSPLARGLRSGSVRRRRRTRIIPARAGFTASPAAPTRTS